jgi:predicted glycoside hydrolase/deacetylase ChbG (UPF0249 family)
MTQYLIVNADDYGMNINVSRGIRDSHLRGIVTSTTVMIGMAGAAEDVLIAQTDTPNLGLGLHVVLAGKNMTPVLPPDQIPSLVRPDGRFYDQPIWGERADLFDADEMTREVNAQFEKFVQVAGRLPTHIDAHYHAPYFHPVSLAAMRALAIQHQIPMRYGHSSDTVKLEGIPHPTAFFELNHDQPVETLIALIQNLPDDEIIELCCHPGYADETLFEIDPWTTVRDIEVGYVTDPRVKAAVESKGFVLSTFEIFKK